MRVRSRQFGVPILSLFFALWFGACSGSQQDEEGLEVQNDEQGEQGNEQSEDNQQSNEEEGGQYADEGDEGSQYGDDTMVESNATENDLQEIIQEMNGSSGGDMMASSTSGMSGGMGSDPMATNMASTPTYAAPVSAAPSVGFQPGGTPAGPGLPEIGSKMPYIVQPGDTLAKISQKIYGKVSRWKEMASLSGLSNPSRIYPGDLVYYTLESASMAFATAYEKTARSQEQVQPGDTLATIAQRVYGSTTGWKAIWRQNDNIGNPDLLKAGSVVFYIASSNLTAELKKQQTYFKSLAAEKAKNLHKTISAEVSAPVKGINTDISSVILADGHLFHKAVDSIQFQI